jgi:hypothetical protein
VLVNLPAFFQLFDFSIDAERRKIPAQGLLYRWRIDHAGVVAGLAEAIEERSALSRQHF